MKKWIPISAIVFVFASCDKEKGPADKNFSLTGFNKLSAGETFTVTVSRGSGFGIYAKNAAGDLADLEYGNCPGNINGRPPEKPCIVY